ncbi:MAG: hypothetical protein GF308_07790 [Candidatus Heimdallarchaeota archaeon]|nr:hypothetical protein [Candidatus Heimdallarchaeota archaeon]
MIEKIIVGKIKPLTAIHVGSSSSARATDAPVFRNVAGEIVIPGTSIGGPLRATATRLAPHLGKEKCVALTDPSSKDFCDCIVCNLFGSINPAEESEGEEEEPMKGNASKVWIYNSPLVHKSKTAIRDGVGIDRETNTSAREMRAKYDHELVPKRSIFDFRIELQDNITPEEEMLLAVTLAEWTQERCYLGGNIARGLGNCLLEDLQVYKLDLSSPEKLLDYLKEDDPLKVGEKEKDWIENLLEKARKQIIAVEDNNYLYNSFIQLDFTLQFTGGFIINDTKAPLFGFDFTPRMENGEFILPGSSIRGKLRSHAEKIVRTLNTIKATNGEEFRKKCPACNPLAEQNNPLTSCSILLRDYRKEEEILPGVEVQDKELCLACKLFGSSYNGSRLFITDGEMVNDITIKVMDFVAIDRFTGGGKEGAKFDAVVLWQPAFKVRLFLENPKEWELGWLFLALRDLKAGFFSIGFGQNNWFGKAEIVDEQITIGTTSDNSIPEGLFIESETYQGIFKTNHWTWEELANLPEKPLDNWLTKFHKQLTEFKRVPYLVPSSDSYFRENIPQLYSKEEEL